MERRPFFEGVEIPIAAFIVFQLGLLVAAVVAFFVPEWVGVLVILAVAGGGVLWLRRHRSGG